MSILFLPPEGPNFWKTVFFLNSLMKAASYSEKFVHVYRNEFCEKRKDFNIIKGANKLLQRTKMGRHTVVFELTERVMGWGDIQWCLNCQGDIMGDIQ
jgi:hypothetical protein